VLKPIIYASENKHGLVNARIVAATRTRIAAVIALYFRGFLLCVRSPSTTTKTALGRIYPAKNAGNNSVTRKIRSDRVQFFSGKMRRTNKIRPTAV
jgi:hypothetical protein